MKSVHSTWCRAVRRTLTSAHWQRANLSLQDLLRGEAQEAARLDGNGLAAAAEKRLRDFPAEARRAVSHMLPLHYALLKQKPCAFVRTIINAYPKAVRTETFAGAHSHALHLAASCGASAATVELLLSAHGASAFQHDDAGELPLHAAARCGARPDVVAALLRANGRAATQAAKPNLGPSLLPLVLALRNGAPTASVELLLAAFPQAVADHRLHPRPEEGPLGTTALHWAAAAAGTAPATIATLLRVSPGAARVRDNNRLRPLEIARTVGASTEVIAMLEAAAGDDEEDLLFD